MTFQPPPPGPTASVAPVPRSIEVIADPTAIAAAYGELSRVGVTTPFQTRDWVAAWVAAGAVEGEAAIVTGWSGERLDFVLPFEILRVGAVAVARWMSGSHAGYNFGLWRREAVPDAGELAALFDTVGRRQRIDVFALDNMPRVWDGLANPIAEAFGATAALDDGHRFRLPARFDELIARRNAGHKRKKLKQKEKLLTAAGDYRIGRAVAVTDRKSTRLNSSHIPLSRMPSSA